ncbi:sugar ABC transporter substrate-binding protein [Bacillus sp. CGMCC 1.60114]|uniref:sugar ABC transporter substrate-binding protein n=1 Tax=unclassified Bacillus (in: firmicutes) TaxID=185979 RepID=UPI003625445B
MTTLKIHVALEQVNFLWDERDVIRFREMWNSDISILAISKILKRKQIEVAVLILDQIDKYKIQGRAIGLGEIGEESIRNKKKYELPPNVYIALEEANFMWPEKDITRFKELWKKRFRFEDIAMKLGRHQIELAILILDQLGLENMLVGVTETEKRTA